MANIKDVALHAGVSIATVSRVINNSDKVRPQTREKVLKAIKALDFMPNFNAQGLQKKVTRTIGLIFPDASSYYFAEIIRGVSNRLKKVGYQIIVASSHDEEDEVRTLISLLHSGRVDGMVLMLPSIQNVNVFNSSLGETPVVYLSTGITTPKTTTVVIDNYQGAKDITSHLIDHGHQKIGFIHGSPYNYDSQERYRGYRQALREREMEHSILYEAHGHFNEATGFKCALDLLGQNSRPTAIFAANDAMAIGAIEAARRLDLRVPDDVAIVGFDDISTAQYIEPALTTVTVPSYDVGKVVGQCLLNKLNNQPEECTESQIVIPLKLKRRKSCGCSVNRQL